MAVAGVKNVEIPRVENLSPERFHRLEKETMEKGVNNVFFGDLLKETVKDWFCLVREFFTKARPVIITDAAEDWPCRQWTIEVLPRH